MRPRWNNSETTLRKVERPLYHICVTLKILHWILFHFQYRIGVFSKFSTLIRNVKKTLMGRWSVCWDIYQRNMQVAPLRDICTYLLLQFSNIACTWFYGFWLGLIFFLSGFFFVWHSQFTRQGRKGEAVSKASLLLLPASQILAH